MKNTQKTKEFALKEITIKGVSYPLELTMGAFLEYKRMTGKDFSEKDQHSISTNIEFIFCIAKTTAKKRGKEFPFEDVIDFASYMTPDLFSSAI